MDEVNLPPPSRYSSGNTNPSIQFEDTCGQRPANILLRNSSNQGEDTCGIRSDSPQKARIRAKLRKFNEYTCGNNPVSDSQNMTRSNEECVLPWINRRVLGFAFCIFAFLFIIFIIGFSVHKIHEGSVGIYFVHGALKDKISSPGINWKIPFFTVVEEVTIRPNTDVLPPISTVTKDGIQNTFNNIQVISKVNPIKLIELVKKFGMGFKNAVLFDRISEELRKFCANHTVDEVYSTMFLDIVNAVKSNVATTMNRLSKNGIEIINLAIPKPIIPPDIANNYKEVKVQWTEQLVAAQQQKTEKIKKEIQSLKAVADAEREKKVLDIDIQKEIARKEGDKKLSSLENEIIKKRVENQANADAYKKTKEGDANKNLYTKEYIQLEMAKSLSENTKFYFSGKSSPLGTVLTKIMGEVKN